MVDYKNIAAKSQNIDEKIDAINSLIIYNLLDKECINFLLNGLVSDNRALRDISSRALTSFPSALHYDVAKSVVHLIGHHNIEIRNLAGDLLIKLGKISSSALLPALKSDDFDIRKFACDIIGLVDDGSSLDIVLQMYDDSDENVVLSSIEAVGNILNRLFESGFDSELYVESLIELYNNGSENLKPQLIESIGKAGGSKSEEFLINLVRFEDDLFLRIASIDSLANVGSNLEICNMLLEEIVNYPEDIQSILLKTVFAIGYRIEQIPELPFHNRQIAYNALNENDADLRAAGLAALGNTYFTEDVEYIINEFKQSNFDTNQFILYNMIENSEMTVFRNFFEKYFDCRINEDTATANLEFINTIISIWDNINDQKRFEVLAEISKMAMTHNCSNKSELIELLAGFEEYNQQEFIDFLYDFTGFEKSMIENFINDIYYYKNK